MKKYSVMIMSAALVASSCTTGAGTGAYAGSQLGSVLGSAIGGIAGGPRGSDIGTIFGMAGGAVVGAAVGDAATADDTEFQPCHVDFLLYHWERNCDSYFSVIIITQSTQNSTRFIHSAKKTRSFF